MSLGDIFFGARKRARSEVALVIEIGSESVGAALVALAPAVAPRIFWSTREEYVFQERLDFARFVRAMQGTLESVLSAVAREGMPAIRRSVALRRSFDEIVVVFNAPWYLAETRTVRTTFNVPPGNLVREINERVMDAAERLVSSLKRDKEKTGIDDGPELIEQALTRVAVNGYETSDLATRHALSYDAALSLAVVSRDVLARVRDAIGKALHHTARISFHTASLVSFATIRDFFPQTENALIVHVGGEITEVIRMRRRALDSSVSFPFGHRTLIRSAAATLGIGLGEAASQMSLVAGRKMALTREVAAALSASENAWKSLFDEALARFMREGILPRDVFVIAPREMGSIFTGFIEREQFAQFLAPAASFSVVPLHERFFREHITFDERVSPDLPLALVSLFLSRFRENSQASYAQVLAT